MALFVDSIPSEPRDLSQYESSIYETAATEGIDLVAKGAVAATEIQLELQRFLLRVAPGRNIGIDQVAVTDALRRWHIIRTIELTYLDAYHQQLNERYKHKLDAYHAMSISASELLFEVGVGIIYSPIHRPGRPTLAQKIGFHEAKTWFTKVTWISPAGAESEPSPLTFFSTEPASALTVVVLLPPANAVAWNVYVGLSEDTLAKQNPGPLAVSEQWTLPDDGLRVGGSPPSGQQPDASLRRTTNILRG